MPYEPIALAADHKNGSAKAAEVRFLHMTLGSPAVEQASPGVGNPDASLSLSGHGNCAGARRGRGDQADSPDSAPRLRARNGHAPRAHTRRRSSAGRGRSDCSRAPLCGSQRRGSVVLGVPSARKSRWVLDRIGRFVKYFPRNVARLGTGRDIGKNLSVWAGVAPASFGSSLSTAPALRALLQHPGEHPPVCPNFLVVPISPAARWLGRFQSPFGLPTTPQPSLQIKFLSHHASALSAKRSTFATRRNTRGLPRAGCPTA